MKGTGKSVKNKRAKHKAIHYLSTTKKIQSDAAESSTDIVIFFFKAGGGMAEGKRFDFNIITLVSKH